MRWATAVFFFFALSSRPAHAEWKIREEYEDKKLSHVSVESDSQQMPIGLKDNGSARLIFSCIPSENELWVQLIWPEPMTSSHTIPIWINKMDDLPEMPFNFDADKADGTIQSFTLNGESISGTMLIGRIQRTKEANFSLSPKGDGREQAAKFDAASLKEKLREVMDSCPKWDYFSRMKNNTSKK